MGKIRLKYGRQMKSARWRLPATPQQEPIKNGGMTPKRKWANVEDTYHSVEGRKHTVWVPCVIGHQATCMHVPAHRYHIGHWHAQCCLQRLL